MPFSVGVNQFAKKAMKQKGAIGARRWTSTHASYRSPVQHFAPDTGGPVYFSKDAASTAHISNPFERSSAGEASTFDIDTV